MNHRILTLSALALVLSACSPPEHTPDDDPAAPNTGAAQDRTPQADRDQSPAERSAGTRPPTASREDSQTPAGKDASELASIVGKSVSDPDGRLLGTTQRVVKAPDSEKKMVVISVSNGTAEEPEVVVPLEELQQGEVPDKLKMSMTLEQLASRPKASDKKYVVLAERSKVSNSEVADEAPQRITSGAGQQPPDSR